MPLFSRLRARLRGPAAPPAPPPRRPAPLPPILLPDEAAPPRSLRDYRPAAPAAFTLGPDAFEPAFLAALTSPDPAALDRLVREIHPGIYTFRPLTLAWCTGLRDEVRRVHTWARRHHVAVEPPNSMNQYGLLTDAVGLDLTPLREALLPLTRRWFPAHAGDTLDHHHAFVVRYAENEDVDLGFHADDAEVTLNLCLGEGFLGGDLYFEGERCEMHRQLPARPGEHLRYAHAPGVALLHAGANRHGAHALIAGERHNLILWARSAAHRAAPRHTCPPWCGS